MLDEIQELKSTDRNSLLTISQWYYREWKIPVEQTIRRLEEHNHEDIIFQLIVKRDNKLIATGGLYNQVGIQLVYPKFREIKPWIALLYTEPSHRNQGIGSSLLKQIEQKSFSMGYSQIYLFTLTAESLYRRQEWREVERLIVKGNDTVIMKKNPLIH